MGYKSKKHCGHCKKEGHSIRTCNLMEAVSVQRLREVMERYKYLGR